MKVTKFRCINQHVFFLPLELPMDISEFARLLNGLTCPLCKCGSESIYVQEDGRIEKHETGEWIKNE